MDHPRTAGVLRLAAGHVRDHDELVDVRRHRGQRIGELGAVAVRDDDRRDHSEHLPVDVERAARGLVPRELRRAREARCDQPVTLGDRLPDRVGEPGRLGIQRGFAGDLAHRRVGGGDHRRATGHRLEHRQAEAFVPRRQNEGGSAAVELRELVLLDVAAQVGAEPLELPGERRLALGPGDDERQADLGRRLRRSERVLPLLDRADVEKVVAAALRPRAERRVDAVRRDRDLRLGHAVQLDQVALRPLGDGDHAAAPAAPRAERHAGRSPGANVPSRSPRARTRDRERSPPPGPPHPNGSACWKCASAGVSRRSARGTDHTMRSSCEPAGTSTGSTPAGTRLRVAGQRSEPELAAGQLGQPPQQVQHVRLVAGAVPAEHVRVENDERRHATAS